MNTDSGSSFIYSFLFSFHKSKS